jgi:phosphate transport system substrate-binding protein
MRWPTCKSAFKSASRSAFVAILTGVLMAPHAANAAMLLRFGGTGTSLGMLQQVGGDFATASGGTVKVEVVPGLGSSGSIHALADGKLDLAVSARPLTRAEAARNLRVVLVVRTPFVLATSHPNPQSLKPADVLKIFEAKQLVWADDSPIRIILRSESETDTQLLGNLAPGMKEAIEAARRRSELPIAATDQENLEMAQRMKGSLTGTTLAQLTTEPNNLHTIAINGVEPTLGNLESGKYPFEKKLYFLLGERSAPEAQKFVTFLQSPQGLKELRAAAVVPDKR